MALPKLVRRNYGKEKLWRKAAGGYQISKSSFFYRRGDSLMLCQNILQTRIISQLHGSALSNLFVLDIRPTNHHI